MHRYHWRHGLVIAALATGISGLPAFAQTKGYAGSGAPLHARGMMSGGCMGMMRPAAGDGRPNSQWRHHRRQGAGPG